MRVILDYDPATGNLKDKTGNYVGCWANLQPLDEENTQSNNAASIDDLIRVMKISAHINNPSKIKDI
jgi:hypothetical protein